MPGSQWDKYNKWVSEVLGIDPAAFIVPVLKVVAHAMAVADSPEGKVGAAIAEIETERKQLEADGIPADGIDRVIAVLRVALAKAGKNPALQKKVVGDAQQAVAKVKRDVQKQVTAATGGADKAIQNLRDAADAQITRIKNRDSKNPQLVRLQDLLAALDGEMKVAGTVTEPDARAKLRDNLDQQAQDLLKAVADATGDSKEAKKAVQDAYKKALNEKYGITFDKNSTFKTDKTHFDKVYEMFEQVPLAHVAHDALSDISYVKRLVNKSGHGIGMFETSSIEFGEFPDGDDPWSYQDVTAKAGDKPKEKPNAFKITVLHELGHSVDKRWNIMDTYGDQKGCGGWQSHGSKSLAAQLAAAAPANGLPASTVLEVVSAALADGKQAAPDGVGKDSLTGLYAYLAPWIAMRNSSNFTPTQAMKGREYFYRGGAWRSYLSSEHAALKVTDYQWSAPAEWFAELYAICWYRKRPAPGSVHAKIRAYLPQEGGGGPGAPG